MNFYDFHIGDYASRTGHLDPMEDLAYRRMLDLYYVREQALPLDVQEIARLIRMRDQAATIRDVLNEFFTETPEGYTHDRCEATIAAAVDKRTKAQASAAKRWDSERTANAMPTHCERTRNAKPMQSEGNAPSPIPSPIPKKKDSASAQPPEGVSEIVWKDFLKTRKTKITDTAMLGIAREAEKAGMTLQQALETACERGWQSFKAEWLKGNAPASRSPPVVGTFVPEPRLTKDQLAANAEIARRTMDALGHRKGAH